MIIMLVPLMYKNTVNVTEQKDFISIINGIVLHDGIISLTDSDVHPFQSSLRDFVRVIG